MDITRKILERAGYSVRCAVGLAGAKEMFSDYQPDGIVLDNTLPDGKGLDYCRELREQSDVPILFVSENREDEIPALQAGADDFMKKPVDFDIMKARIGAMLHAKAEPWTEPENDGETGGPLPLQNEIKPVEERQPVWQNEPAAEPTEKKKTGFKKYIPVAVAACLVIAIAGFGASSLFNNLPGYLNFIDDPVPLAIPFYMEANVVPYTGQEPVVVIPDFQDVTIPAGETALQIPFVNPGENSCYFGFKIILIGTEETIYSSGLIEPGKCIEDPELAEGLEPGDYPARIQISVYDYQTFLFMKDINTEICITAE